MCELRDIALLLAGATIACAAGGLTLAIRDLLARLDKQDGQIGALQSSVEELKEVIGGKRLSNLGIAMNEDLTGLLIPALQAVERLRTARGFFLDNVDEIDMHTQLLKDRLGRMRNGDWHKNVPSRRGDGHGSTKG